MKKISLYDWFRKNSNRLIIPSIQRNFVWKDKNIEKLFDSIYHSFFIGTFCIWKPNKTERMKMDCFSLPTDMIKNYRLENCDPTPKSIFIIDGQQRMSAISIALNGTYNKKTLCFNTTHNKKNAAEKTTFKFKNENEIDHKTWLTVAEIMSSKQGKKLKPNVKKFKENFKNLSLLKYDIEPEKTLTEVTEIFRRLNNGGKQLSHSQDLLSRLAAIWPESKKKFDALQKTIAEEYKLDISSDFIAKTCLFCLEQPIKIKLTFDEKDQKIVNRIQKGWGAVEKAIIQTVKVLSNSGFSSSNITSYNALIPIVYAFYHKNSSAKDPCLVSSYVYRACLLNKFSQGTDDTLMKARDVMKGGDLKKLFREYTASDSDIIHILQLKKGKSTKLALKLLYGYIDKQAWHDDHMHPEKGFESSDEFKKRLKQETRNIKTIERTLKKFKRWKVLSNQLPNLQALPGNENTSKNKKRLTEWIDLPEASKFKKNFEDKKVFLDSANRNMLYLYNFEKFFNIRRNEMKRKLKKELQ